MVLAKTLESPLDSKEIRPVNHKGNQSWIFIARTGAKVEASILWPPDAKSWLTGKERDWGQEEKRVTEDEMIRWHHQLDGHESEQALGDSEGQRSLVCCSSRATNSRTWLSNWTTIQLWPSPSSQELSAPESPGYQATITKDKKHFFGNTSFPLFIPRFYLLEIQCSHVVLHFNQSSECWNSI